MGLGTILLVILILMLIGAVPSWPHSKSWGYGPSGGLGLVVLILIILLVLLRPGITFTRQTTPRGTVAVLIDASASMQLPSGDGKATRWELEKEIWELLWNARASLGKDASLVPYLYDSTLKPLGEGKDGASAKLPIQPEGFSTDIGGPLSQLMSSPLESPLSEWPKTYREMTR